MSQNTCEVDATTSEDYSHEDWSEDANKALQDQGKAEVEEFRRRKLERPAPRVQRTSPPSAAKPERSSNEAHAFCDKPVEKLAADKLNKEPAPAGTLLHGASVYGEVVEIEADAMVVRFDVGGMPELRRIFWSDTLVSRQAVVPGLPVIGRTQLISALPEVPEAAAEAARLAQLRDSVEQDLAAQDLAPETQGRRVLTADGGETGQVTRDKHSA